jgi:DUF4097 and DUF4098 domain-containing protein YvlB
MRRLSFHLATLIVLLLAGAPLAYAQGVHESTVSAAPDALVTIRVVDTQVRVVGAARRDVKVSTTADDMKVTSDGSRVSIEVRPGSGASLDVAVPSGARVEVHDVNASASVRGVAGPVQVHTVNGDAEVEGAARDVDARSVSGRVDVSVQHADVRASAVSGNVSVRLAAGGTVWAKTVSGTLRVTGAPLTRLEAQTVSGTVDLDVRLDGSGPFEAHTHAGDVHVVLPKGSSVTVDTRSYHGLVDNPDAGGGPPDAGHPVLTVSTFSGNVRVERK